MDEGEIVQEYSAKIIAWDGDSYDGGSTIGNAEFYIVKVAAAMNRGISLMHAIDSVNQDVYECGAAVLGPDTGDIRADLVERFECIGGDLMFLHLMKVLPAYRGRDIGLVAASRLIDSYGRFSKDRREAKRRLQNYWSRLGFEPISDDDEAATTVTESDIDPGGDSSTPCRTAVGALARAHDRARRCRRPHQTYLVARSSSRWSVRC